MVQVHIDRHKCKGCLLCIEVCPRRLIGQNTHLNRYGLKPAVFKKRGGCTGCSFCALVCPECCIEVGPEAASG